MRALVTVVVLLVSAGQGWLWACGDKFFMVGTGVRLSRAFRALHPSDVLIYTGGISEGSELLRARFDRLARAFGEGGHHVIRAATPEALNKALTTMNVDLVFTDVDTTSAIEGTVLSAKGAPLLFGGAAPNKVDKGKGKPKWHPPGAEGDYTVVSMSADDTIIGVLVDMDKELEQRKKSRQTGAGR